MLSVQVRGVASGPLHCQRSASAWQRHETLLGYVRIRMNASTCVHLAGNRVHYTYTLAQLPRDSARWRGDAVTSAQAASAHTDSRARPPADRWTPVIVVAAGTGHDAQMRRSWMARVGAMVSALSCLLPGQVRARPPRGATQAILHRTRSQAASTTDFCIFQRHVRPKTAPSQRLFTAVVV